jgi:cell pole-organizing protein PopZ
MPATSAMRDQTMEEILASIHRMIVEGEGETAADGEAAMETAAPDEAGEGRGAPDEAALSDAVDGMVAEVDIDADWIAAGVAAILESSRAAGAAAAPEAKALEAERRFVEGFSAGAEDVALVDAPETRGGREATDLSETKVEKSMSEQQRAAVAAVPIAGPAPARPEVPRKGPESIEDRILSEATNAAVGASFDQLSRTILSQNPRTLEDLVRDLMRPMLRSWLDQNLPRIAERMVKQEIERIARGDR